MLLKESGMTGRDIAAVLGISEQRISQLAKAAKKAA
ncbi:sigma factor-like helix-turn-helix DNA-binding protein [Glycomyces paridis]|nr:sigma factor-like helix-turn-helix DNA-binding protein [Glycomyces paridis]